MGMFMERLGFLIRILALIFTWAVVAIFISPEFAALMGAAVILLWLIVFLPKSLLDEVLWQKKATVMMKEAVAQAPLYQSGTALPAPDHYAPQSSSAETGGAIDVWRDLPQLQFEPRNHVRRFWRSFALPLVGLFMIFSASNDSFVRGMMGAVGIKKSEAIEWAALKLPDAMLTKREEMEAAARLALRREPYCGHITAGQIEPLTPFLIDGAAIKAELDAGRYRYLFTCAPTGQSAGHQSLTIWALPDDVARGTYTSIFALLHKAPTAEAASSLCRAKTREAVRAMGVTLADMPLEAPSYFPGSLPYPDHARLIGIETLYREGQVFGKLEVNCYVGPKGEVETRFARPSSVPPILIHQ